MPEPSIAAALGAYDKTALTLCSVGSHSALDVAFGARAQGLRNLIITATGRERTYAQYYARRASPRRGCVDATLHLDTFAGLLDPAVQERLLAENALFVANRSFEVYLHERYSYDEIERRMLVPFFGNRRLLRAEERDEPANQYALLARAGIRHPRSFDAPHAIDTLVMVKAQHARVSFERAFFLCSSPAEYRVQAGRLLAAGMVDEAGARAGADRGIRARSEREPQLFLVARPRRTRTVRDRYAAADEPRRSALVAAGSTRGRRRDSGADGRSGAHRDDADRVDARESVRSRRTLRTGLARRKSSGRDRTFRATVAS